MLKKLFFLLLVLIIAATIYEGKNFMINNTEVTQKIYDLTTSLTKDTVVFPGDPLFEIKEIQSITEHNHFKLCHLGFSNHAGTHIDFPSHVLKDGKTSSSFSLEELIGDGVIIEVPDNQLSISKSFVEKQTVIFQGAYVFFKTSNSKIPKTQDHFTKQYVYIEPEAAEELIKKGVKIIGIDYLSVDHIDAEELPVHKSLLSKGILIVENLELNDIPEGKYKIFIAPLKIEHIDGAPARIFATPMMGK